MFFYINFLFNKILISDKFICTSFIFLPDYLFRDPHSITDRQVDILFHHMAFPLLITDFLLYCPSPQVRCTLDHRGCSREAQSIVKIPKLACKTSQGWEKLGRSLATQGCFYRLVPDLSTMDRSYGFPLLCLSRFLYQ